MTTVFWLWLTICPSDVANARCETERHMCVRDEHRDECAELIRQKKPTSAIWRPVDAQDHR